MAEPLKNSFGPDVVERIADWVSGPYPELDRARFVADVLDGFDDLELTPRARRISDVLAEHLPEDRKRSLEILIEALGPEIAGSELTGMDSFAYLPMVFFIADHGIDHFETAMRAQYEITKRFTAEFSIRAYLERYPAESLARLETWAHDANVHVRRLVSEGTRPRLPWAPRLRGFQEDPTPVVALLEILKDDPEEYVRRSVANNLNDISKDHPDVVVEVARRWWTDGDRNRRRLVRHALRTLIKQGNEGALGVLGYGLDSPARVTSVTIIPEEAGIGDKVRLEAVVENPSEEETGALVDFRVHFVKANGSTSPKVFKGAERTLAPGDVTTVRKSISLAQHSTRTHYPGEHTVEIMLNGRTVPGGTFSLLA